MPPAETPKITTIKLNAETKERIDKLRVHKRETYDEILQRMLGMLNLLKKNPERAQVQLRVIDKKHKTHEQRK